MVNVRFVCKFLKIKLQEFLSTVASFHLMFNNHLGENLSGKRYRDQCAPTGAGNEPESTAAATQVGFE